MSSLWILATGVAIGALLVVLAVWLIIAGLAWKMKRIIADHAGLLEKIKAS